MKKLKFGPGEEQAEAVWVSFIGSLLFLFQIFNNSFLLV